LQFLPIQNKKIAELRYEIIQLSDFNIPSQFVERLGYAPVAIRVENTGDKAAENVILDATTKHSIEKCETEPQQFMPRNLANNVYLSIERLNPGQTFRMS
jgi:hypothetical protein